nr:MAG TPA: hypothetical protein [Caudoviricetes sp.]DAY34946.1 MAG TPA: hypothetical protein [Bacteriophage sp.]
MRTGTSKVHHILVLLKYLHLRSCIVRVSYSICLAHSYSHFHDINLFQHLSLELHSYAIRSLHQSPRLALISTYISTNNTLKQSPLKTSFECHAVMR